MDRIMPIDLENAKLRTSLRGYEKEAVDALLTGAATSIATFVAENEKLREANEKLRSEIDAHRSQEGILRDTLVLAQKTADETRAAAQKHCEAIVEEARLAASAERRGLEQQASDLRWEIERLRADRKRFAEEYREFLERHLREAALLSDRGMPILADS